MKRWSKSLLVLVAVCVMGGWSVAVQAFDRPCYATAATPTWKEGDSAPCSTDLSGNMRFWLNSLIEGEDPTVHVMKVEQRFSFQNVATSTTTTIKSGPGLFGRLNIWNAGATGNSITCYDNTAASGTVILTFTPPVVGSYDIGGTFSIGLTCVTAGTTPPNMTVSYR